MGIYMLRLMPSITAWLLEQFCLVFLHRISLITLVLSVQVVLDLDETLVSAYESSSLPAIVRTQAVEAGLHCFDMECISSDKVPNFYYYPLLNTLNHKIDK